MQRIGIKVGHMLLAFFTRNHLRERMKDMEHLPGNGLYREAFFRFLLDSEAKRSQRSGHRYQVLLIFRVDASGVVVPMPPDLAQTVISTLSRTVRETDYIGWYREGSVVGGVLTVLGRDSLVDACHRLRTGLVDQLQAELGSERSRDVQIRVFQQDEVQRADLI